MTWTTTLDEAYRHALHTIGGSDVNWVNVVFRWCVVVLVRLAAYLGISYEAINIILFVVVLPGLLMTSLALNLYLVRRLRLLVRRSLNLN